MHVSIISPERVVFDGDGDAVTAPAYDGMVGILRRHAPFMTLLGDGVLTVRRATGVETFHVRGGFLQVVSDAVSVIAEYADEDRQGSS